MSCHRAVPLASTLRGFRCPGTAATAGVGAFSGEGRRVVAAGGGAAGLNLSSVVWAFDNARHTRPADQARQTAGTEHEANPDSQLHAQGNP